VSEGFIYLHRKLQKNWIYDDAEFLKAWVTFLFSASHTDCKLLVGKRIVELKRGQFVFGRKAFSARIGISENRLRRFVKMLEIEQMIHQQKTNKYSIISITNYDDYQTYNPKTTTKAPTDHQQTTTNNNVNNNNNISAAPKLLEVEQYFHDKNCLELAEEFFEYWSEREWKKNGKPLARWRSNAATWIRNNKRFFGEEAVAKDELEGFDHPIYGKIM